MSGPVSTARPAHQHGLRTHVNRVQYSSCRDSADIVSNVIQDGGHTWPGSTAIWPPELGPVDQEIDANEIMWRFLQTHTDCPA